MKNKIKPIIEKPKKPIEPDYRDRVKYPQPKTKDGTNYLGEPIFLPNSDYIKDCEKYRKDIQKYNIDVEIYEQTKLIKFVKNADIKLILKKYKIIKK